MLCTVNPIDTYPHALHVQGCSLSSLFDNFVVMHTDGALSKDKGDFILEVPNPFEFVTMLALGSNSKDAVSFADSLAPARRKAAPGALKFEVG